MGSLLRMLLVLLSLIWVSVPPCSSTGPRLWQLQQERRQERQEQRRPPGLQASKAHPSHAAAGHPDLPGLFALRDSICSAPACLPSWRPAAAAAAAADPCGGAFEGVECGAGGRVVAVSVRLDPGLVAFADYSPGAGGPRLPNLAELSVVCPSPPADSNGSGRPGKTAPAGAAAASASAAAAAAAVAVARRRPGGGGADPQPRGPGSLPGAWGGLMPGLKHLKVDGCGAEGALPAPLAARRGLVTLSLPRNALTEWPQDLSGLPALQLLDLSHNALSPPPPASWAAPALRYLYIGGNPGLAAPGALPAAWAESFPQLMLADVSPPAGRGAAEAPRPWARAFCVREGAFVCLAAEADGGGNGGSNGGDAHGGGGGGHAAACGTYLRGTSAKHWDWQNRCDHPSQAAPLAAAWLAVAAAAAALIAWHRHRLREDAAAALGGGADGRGWVLTPGTSPQPPRLQSQQAPPGRAHQVSPFAAYAQVGAGGVAGPGGGGGGNNASSSSRGSSSAAQPRQQRGGGGGGGALAVPLLPTGVDEALPSTSYGPGRSDSAHLPSALAFQTPPRWGAGAAAVAQAARARARAEAAPAAGAGAPGGAGPLARLAAASNGHQPSAAAAGMAAGAAAPVPAAAPSFMDHLLPLAACGADAAAFTRLVVLWGVSPPGPAFWPSYVLIGLLAAPHVALAAVELLRATAAAAVPAALRAASPAAPLERGVAGVAGWVSMAPWWVAYPALAALAAPGLALLSALLPLTLPLHVVGLVSHEAALRYTNLLQACSALTLAPAAAVLLSVLLLLGNTPASRAFLTPNLFWLPFLCAAADMLTGLHLTLARSRAARQQSALEKQRTRPLPPLGP